MSPAPLVNAFSSIAAYEDAVIERRLHENAAFRDIAEYATRGHALALPIVREEHFKKTGTALARGSDYYAAICAGHVYDFLGTFAGARAAGIDYEGALLKALESNKASSVPPLFIYMGSVDDSVRYCNEHLQCNRNTSDKTNVTRDALVEVSFAIQFLSKHLNQYNRIPQGSALAIHKIRADVGESVKAGTGLENAAREENTSPEFLFMKTAQSWFQQQAMKSMAIENNVIKKLQQGFLLSAEIETMLDTGALYREICISMNSILGTSVESGTYHANFYGPAKKAAENEPIDSAVVLHYYMEKLLEKHVPVLQADESERGQEVVALFAKAFSALMRDVDEEFPLRTVAARQSAPNSPALT